MNISAQTIEALIQKRCKGDVEWCGQYGEPGYERVRVPAYAEYQRVRASAYAEYERVRAPAYAEFERATASAWDEYERATAGAFFDASQMEG